MTRTSRLHVAVVVAVALVVAACGGGDDPPSASSDRSDRSDASEGRAGAISDVKDVKDATIQIVSKGSFVQPADSLATFVEIEGAGSGSGFIIDPSGIAVTNNHVVTGNASLEVFVAGGDDPVSARVLGVSECSDLAVIKLDGGPYPYLDWYDGDIDAGLEVRAAGFPLGDPEYTLTNGIVSKAEADGDTDWASVSSVIEHDANIQPGNSGGPLVDVESGRVVAVNYAGGDVGGTGTSQFFAISSKLAEPLVEELEEGDVESLGVNGVAVVDEETGVAGIWVASVDTNSPAGQLGLRGGDIIERIEGLALGTDGTMKDYCDVLRSRQPSDRLSVQVLRFDEDVRLRGEFNGDELSEFESLGTVIEEETGPGTLTGGTAYTDFTEVSDDSGSITVQVPTSWAQVDGSAITLENGTVIPNVSAAPDLGAFFATSNAPGLSLSGAGPEIGTDVNLLLTQITSSIVDLCTPVPAEPYDDGLYTGVLQVFTNCGGTGAVALGIAAQPADKSFTALVLIQLATEADIAVADKVIETFIVAP
ncbi:MAG: S1C family serine protease [Acidimicrobiia bacterium]